MFKHSKHENQAWKSCQAKNGNIFTIDMEFMQFNILAH